MPPAALAEENIPGAITKAVVTWRISQTAIPILRGASPRLMTAIHKRHPLARFLSAPAPSEWRIWLGTVWGGVSIIMKRTPQPQRSIPVGQLPGRDASIVAAVGNRASRV